MTAIIIAVIAAVGSLAAATYQYRAERQRAHLEADVGRETLIDARINAHLQRLDDEVDELRKRNRELAGRVEELSHQLDIAIAYIQMNKLPWPPFPTPEKESTMTDELRDIGIRAFKTFIQVFIAGITAEVITGFDIDTLQTAGLSGLAAGISVLMNAALNWANSE